MPLQSMTRPPLPPTSNPSPFPCPFMPADAPPLLILPPSNPPLSCHCSTLVHNQGSPPPLASPSPPSPMSPFPSISFSFFLFGRESPNSSLYPPCSARLIPALGQLGCTQRKVVMLLKHLGHETLLPEQAACQCCRKAFPFLRYYIIAEDCIHLVSSHTAFAGWHQSVMPFLRA